MVIEVLKLNNSLSQLLMSIRYWLVPALAMLALISMQQVVMASPYTAIILNIPEPANNSHFGFSGAGIGDVSGDGVPDIAVSGGGKIFLFSGADRSLLDTIDHPIPESGGLRVVASIGDIDGDSVPDLAVGGGALDASAGTQVFLFSGADRSLLDTIDNPTESGNFGTSLAGTGDIDGDDVPDFMVGIEGHAFVFSGADRSLLHTLDAFDDPSNNIWFGRRIAGIGDVNSDGVPDFLVGDSTAEADGNFSQGQAYVYSGVTGNLIYAPIDNPIPDVSSGFGSGVAGIGDVNGDGVPDLIVGAPGHDEGPFQAKGIAWVFNGATGVQLYPVINPVFGEFTGFGASVAGIADANSDGIPDLLVGAKNQDQAHLFSGMDGSLLDTLDDPTPDSSGISAHFGDLVTGVGDINLDGAPDLLIGALFKTVEELAQGQAFLFLSGLPVPPKADLFTTKVVDNTTPDEGQVITYTLTITNNGPDDATDVSLTDQLPLGVSYVSSTPSQGDYDSTTGVWVVGSLANGTSATLLITATVDTGAGGSTITNTIVNVSATEEDPSTDGDDLSEAVSVPSADLLVSQGADKTEVRKGDEITFTLTVQNFGPSTAANVVVTDTLSADLAFVSASATKGSFKAPPVGQTGTVDWNLGDLQSGDSEDAQLVVTVLVRGLTTLSNTADVTADTADGNLTNNTTTLDIAVLKGKAGKGGGDGGGNGKGKGNNK